MVKGKYKNTGYQRLQLDGKESIMLHADDIIDIKIKFRNKTNKVLWNNFFKHSEQRLILWGWNMKISRQSKL